MRRLERLLPTDPHENEKRYQPFYTLDEQAWRELVAKCTKLGIPYDFIVISPIFDGMRADYERRVQQAHPTSLQRRKARRDRSILKSASAIIAFLKEERAFFGSMGDDLERLTAAYRQQHVDPWLSPRAVRLPRHRPEELWLKQWILDTAREMRKHGTSLRTIIREIPQIITLGGHGDLITPEKVRHAIRKARKEDPAFAALFAPPGGLTRPLPPSK
jgi:hypothetical protein